MIKTLLKKKSVKYFNDFSCKSLHNLNEIFSKNISLEDWENKLKGKNKVLKFNADIFKKFKKININIKNIAIDEKNKIVFCQIKIKLDKVSLEVIDVLKFNKKNLIDNIRAYKI